MEKVENNNNKSFQEVLKQIQTAKQKAFSQVNTILVELYWNIGNYVSKQVKQNIWGRNTVEKLSLYIKKKEPTIKGFSSRNIWTMKQFYETYSENEKLPSLVAELSWTHNRRIMSLKTKFKELSQSKEFRKSINESINPKRMKDRYLILRFISFYLWRKQELINSNNELISYKSDNVASYFENFKISPIEDYLIKDTTSYTLENIIIHYFEYPYKKTSIYLDERGHFIDKKGEFIDFPDGFFDATLSELIEIGG